MTMYKKIVAVGIGVMVLMAGVFYALPYIRVIQIISALEEQDGARLGRYCDFPQLRQGIPGRDRLDG